MLEVINPAEPRKVFYHQVKKGDITKYFKISNISSTGGGARDLRISPKSLWESMEDFFPEAINNRQKKGIIFSEIHEEILSAEVQIMAPTNARPNEVRICKINKVKGWEISLEEYNTEIDSGFYWFYLLILDANKRVWAAKFSTRYIDEMHESISSIIEAELDKNSQNAIRGVINC